MRPIKFFLCTRDRPNIARHCIAGVKNSISDLGLINPAVCYIFDDSTTKSNSVLLRQMCNLEASETFHLEVVDSAYQIGFIEKLTRTTPVSPGFIHSICKTLGTGPWDLAGVRNFAFIYAYVFSDPDDLLIFLDDDMGFTDLTYQGHFIPVNGTEVIKQLHKAVIEDNALAAGVGYQGRRDTSIIEHLTNICGLTLTKLESAVLPEALSYIEQLDMFPAGLPIQLSLPGDNLDIGLGPAGISGAVLAISPSALLSHYLMRRYNEDWIWLALLGHNGTEIKRVKETVVHAAPAQSPITIDFMVYQEIGQIIFNAINNTACQLPAGQDRVEWCEKYLNITQVLEAKEKQVKDIEACLHAIKRVEESPHVSRSGRNSTAVGVHNALNLVNRVKQAIVDYSPQQILDEILIYLDEKQIWREALIRARAELKDGEYNVQPALSKGS